MEWVAAERAEREAAAAKAGSVALGGGAKAMTPAGLGAMLGGGRGQAGLGAMLGGGAGPRKASATTVQADPGAKVDSVTAARAKTAKKKPPTRRRGRPGAAKPAAAKPAAAKPAAAAPPPRPTPKASAAMVEAELKARHEAGAAAAAAAKAEVEVAAAAKKKKQDEEAKKEEEEVAAAAAANKEEEDAAAAAAAAAAEAEAEVAAVKAAVDAKEKDEVTAEPVGAAKFSPPASNSASADTAAERKVLYGTADGSPSPETSVGELAKLIEAGVEPIHAGTLVWSEGMDAWEPLGEAAAKLGLSVSLFPLAPAAAAAVGGEADSTFRYLDS